MSFLRDSYRRETLSNFKGDLAELYDHKARDQFLIEFAGKSVTQEVIYAWMNKHGYFRGYILPIHKNFGTTAQAADVFLFDMEKKELLINSTIPPLREKGWSEEVYSIRGNLESVKALKARHTKWIKSNDKYMLRIKRDKQRFEKRKAEEKINQYIDKHYEAVKNFAIKSPILLNAEQRFLAQEGVAHLEAVECRRAQEIFLNTLRAVGMTKLNKYLAGVETHKRAKAKAERLEFLADKAVAKNSPNWKEGNRALNEKVTEFREHGLEPQVEAALEYLLQSLNDLEESAKLSGHLREGINKARERAERLAIKKLQQVTDNKPVMNL